MRRFGWIKDILDWIIRLQGAYSILATIIAGALGTVARAVLTYYTRVPSLWVTPIWLFIAAVTLAVFSILGSKLGSFVNYPDFQLLLNTIIWSYDPERDLTRFYLGARLLNRGAPSIALSWSAMYFLGETKEEMKYFYLVDPSVLAVGGERLTVANEDLLNVKTAEKAVERGGAVYGRLLFTLPGNRDAQIKALQFKIEVKVEDYTSCVSTAVYVPSSEPVPYLIRHPFEKSEFVPAPEKAIEGGSGPTAPA